LLLVAAACEAAATNEQAPYAVPHAMIDVNAGRRLNLYCVGNGAPTVVFDAGSGLAGWDWLLVHPSVAARTRACIYDRAGFGFSDAADRPGTSANAVDDLHRLLNAAGVAPPYILVGHSYGGDNVQLYAYTYPREVAGLVLVDASHEDETERLDRITHGKFSKLMTAQNEAGLECVSAARSGLLPGTERFEQCVGQPPPMYRIALAAAWLSMHLSTEYWDAAESEARNQSVSDAQLRQARGSFGDMPLVYLTHGISPFLVPGKPQSAMNKATEKDFVRMHEEVARLSKRGSHRVVPGAAHSIHIDQPQAVIDAISDVLAQTRK
jgi:pimeloyl-ACP methyl ester carboxylesterase